MRDETERRIPATANRELRTKLQRDLKSTERTSSRSAHEEVCSETTPFPGTNKLQDSERTLSVEEYSPSR